MTCSMTAYAHDVRVVQDNVLGCEIKTVNHRYFDLSLRAAEIFRPLETDINRKIHAKLARGRVECTIDMKPRNATSYPQLDDEALVALAAEMGRAEEILRGTGFKWMAPSLIDMVRWRDVAGKAESVDPKQMGRYAMELLDQTLDNLIGSRQEEGARLEGFILARRDELAEIIAKLRRRYPLVLAAAREKFSQKLASVDTGLEPQRMAQETALLVQKFCIGADIEEELDRCDSHIEELGAIFRRTEPVGRRLDFLMQEMNREINTIGSKSADTETVHIAIDAKTLVEQMREQVQNIE